jgi:D-methionine transport system ATP-binding protein
VVEISNPLIELIRVGKSFGTVAGGAAAVRDVSLQIRAGEIFGIIGESGAGKSTLVRLMNLLERPTSGQVLIEGEDLAAMTAPDLRRTRRRIGMIFQHFNLLNSRTVAQNVALPLQLEGRLNGPAVASRVSELLDRVGLSGMEGQYPARLSGGQKQRVGIARALACGPKVLLCDEATSALDPETTVQVLDLLAELNRDLGLTIVFITHEMDAIRRICDRVAVLDAGCIVEMGEVIEVFLNAGHPSTRRLLRQGDLLTSSAGEGRTFRLTCRGPVASAPFLSRVVKDAGVDFSLYSGRMDRIKGEPYGQLILSFEGGRIGEALASLRAAGVRVEELPR